MNRNNKWMRIGIPLLLSAMMAGTAARVLTSSLGMPCGLAEAYLPALAAALLCGLASLAGLPASVAAGAGIVIAAAGACLLRPEWIREIKGIFSGSMNSETAARCVSSMAWLVSAAWAAATYCMLYHSGAEILAALTETLLVVLCCALTEDAPLLRTVPGMVASVTALALYADARREGNVFRAMIPAVLVVTAALMLTPVKGVTWQPLEDAAERVRAMFEEYFHFTEERVPFTLHSKGYDYAAESGGVVVSQLGGPAKPDTAPVMEVTADRDVLLRGAVRRTYTGHAWVDYEAKRRSLFYAVVGQKARQDAFCMFDSEGFVPVHVSVEMLADATSTLFVTGRLERFDMTRLNAVYFNTVGELFMARPVQPGDRYTFVGACPQSMDALRAATAKGGRTLDGEMRALCTALADGIDDDVFRLVYSITEGCESDLDRAVAIRDWLRQNCVYTLSPDYPDPDTDFVSQFVLHTREGYCSYFASAMTVMCRIAGIPARYVEGYSVEGTGEPVIVTGENAHAWTEVWFDGVGWVPFDVSNGDGGGSDGLSNGQDGSAPDQLPEPTPTPTLPPSDGQTEPTPEPTEAPNEAADAPTPEPTREPQTEPTLREETKRGSKAWLLILPILLLLTLAALLIRGRLRAVDPALLSKRTESARDAAMILYRSLLTLLLTLGYAPEAEETPTAFARRVNMTLPNDLFEDFSRRLSDCVYAGRDADAQLIKLGCAAYDAFLRQMRMPQRARFTLRRFFKGLGDFERIP